jgi:hypothetical protein
MNGVGLPLTEIAAHNGWARRELPAIFAISPPVLLHISARLVVNDLDSLCVYVVAGWVVMTS